MNLNICQASKLFIIKIHQKSSLSTSLKCLPSQKGLLAKLNKLALLEIKTAIDGKAVSIMHGVVKDVRTLFVNNPVYTYIPNLK